MTTPKEPSVINPDIPPPPRSNTSAPSGDRPLSPTTTPAVPSGLPVSRVQVITTPQTTTTPVETVDASIHAPSNS
ncbi:unnamed protein product [Rhizophagus irregularis]|nr:unnamed protein product [Rhizophagus irregularis]